MKVFSTIVFFSIFAIFVSNFSYENVSLNREPATFNFVECLYGLEKLFNFKKVFENDRDKIAYEMILENSVELSRTISRDLAPHGFEPNSIVSTSRLAHRNFEETVYYMINYRDQLSLSLKTAIDLNKKLTKDMVPRESWGNVEFRLNGTYTNQDEDFVNGNPYHFYRWLESREGKAMSENNPILFAEIIHNSISALDSFPDGNGRLARLMADLALMRSGRAPALYTDIDEYFKRGNARSQVSRAERIRYFKEAVERGQIVFDQRLGQRQINQY